MKETTNEILTTISESTIAQTGQRILEQILLAIESGVEQAPAFLGDLVVEFIRYHFILNLVPMLLHSLLVVVFFGAVIFILRLKIVQNTEGQREFKFILASVFCLIAVFSGFKVSSHATNLMLMTQAPKVYLIKTLNDFRNEPRGCRRRQQ
jgi:hypothetical protein